ncbi:hypothetical protein Taro_044309 [Colocasia esculenta]|uniref:Uncharacterized protein n=1 Tax=Colocasia esculenta TaxID=4460 RepID=A0A843WTP3_COLES|nr:hypothetical protein [Colocasia esculenta]
MGRRRLSPSRLGRDGKVRRDPNHCAVFKQAGRTELSQALLDQGRSCCRRFGVSVEFSSHSRREDVARSGGNSAPCMDWVFFMKWWYLVVVVGYPRFIVSQERCARGVSWHNCVAVLCVVEILRWYRMVVVSSFVLGGPYWASDLLRLTPLQFFSGVSHVLACSGIVADLYHQQLSRSSHCVSLCSLRVCPRVAVASGQRHVVVGNGIAC